MAYLCPANTDNITVIITKTIKIPLVNINTIGAVVNKSFKASTPVLNTVNAIITKTVVEPGMAYNGIFTSIMSKAAFMPIMTPIASSATRPLTGQFWPRNIIVRS